MRKRENAMRRLCAYFVILVLVVACTPPAESTQAPITTEAPAINSTATDNFPTPTREGDTGQVIPTQDGVEGDPGSGFGFENNFTGGFMADINGLTVNGEGWYTCDTDAYLIQIGKNATPQVTLRIPANLQPNTHMIGTQNISATVTVEATTASATSGVIVLNNFAFAPNQQVSGSFSFEAPLLNEATSVSGEFDFFSSEDAAYCS